ncbi:AIR synthase related protein [Streptomyces sp. NPDC060064]|uniref:AIR synthase related protein n=1 Tax=Streptomyces sp. NPDC060064 TaxID=3347049 RepID=UPI0036B8FC04
MQLTVFLSFENHQKNRAVWLGRELAASGFRVIMEDDFGASSPRVEMANAIQDCDLVVALVTSAYAHARATQRELDFAEAFGKKVVAVFTGLSSRSAPAKSYTAYRRLEISETWEDTDAQWRQVHELLVRLLHQEVQASPPSRPNPRNNPSGVPLENAVLLYDIEDRALADLIIQARPGWRRKGGPGEANATEIPHVLLWTVASAETYSLGRKELEHAAAESPVYLAVAGDAPPPAPELDAPSFSVNEFIPQARRVASRPGRKAAPQSRVAKLNEQVLAANDRTPINVLVDRLCCSPRVAELAADAYRIAVSELNAGDHLRLSAVYNQALALRFRGDWRQAVELIHNELLATPSDLTAQAENLRLHLTLERMSLEYELGDRRSAGIEQEITNLQLEFRAAGELPGYVQTGRVLGNVLRERGKFDAGERVIQRTIGVAEYLAESTDGSYGDLVLADCLRELAQLYVARMDFTRARSSLKDAKQLLAVRGEETHGAARYLSAVLMYVDATIDDRDGTHTHADPPTERAHSALEILSGFENPIRLATIYDWLGRAWTRHVPSRRENLTRAEEYLRKALRMREVHGHSYTLGLSHLSLGGLYEVLGNMERALDSYELGRQVFNQRGLRPALARAHAALARGYFRMSRSPDDDAGTLYREHLEHADRLYQEIRLAKEGMELRFELEHSGRRAMNEVPDNTPLISVGEYHFHKWIREHTATHGPELDRNFSLTVGIGDDAAVVSFDGASNGQGLVYTTDSAPGSLAEPGKSPEYVGRFTVVQTLADIISMGAQPVGLLLNLFLSRSVSVGYARRLIEAVVREAARYGVAVIGGDAKERSEQSVGCVGIGYVDKSRILTRNSVRQGHAIGITLASSPTGGCRPIGTRWAQELVEYYRMDRSGVMRDFPQLRKVVDPKAKYELLYLPDRVMASAVRTGLMKSAMDTSDGVLACLEILGRESSVGFELDEAAITDIIGDEARTLAGILGLPTGLFLFSAGHDWEVVFACEEADFAAVAAAVEHDLRGNGRVVRIGTAVQRTEQDESGVRIRRTNGEERLLQYYTDEKFVPRRYQDRPSQWLTFANRFAPDDLSGVE